ncbi:MAG: ATP-binding protein [Terriglobales bacterium]
MSPLDTTHALGRWASLAAYRSRFIRYFVAVALPALATVSAVAVLPVGSSPYFPLFSVSVVAAAVYGGVGAGLTATAASVLLNLFFVAVPRFSLRVASPEDALRLVIFVVAGVAISFVIGAVGELQGRLDRERERLHVTLTSIGDAVIATDPLGEITFMNPMAESATGWKAEDAMGRPLPSVFRIVNEATREPAENPVAKVLQSGHIVGLANHTVLIRKDGSEIAIDDSAAPIRNRDWIVGVVLVFRDISEKRKTEKAMVEAQKLASVGRLAATIAHEINNPLESITNLIYLINIVPDLPANAKTYAEMAQQQVLRAAHVTRQTLAFARRSDEREHCLLRSIADEVLELYEPSLEQKRIQVMRKYGEGAYPVYASRSELRQLLGNLLANAIDALPYGGRLHLRLRGTAVDGQARVRLSVADSGGGIPAPALGKIFDAFFTTKKDVGTGLGLWVSKTIVESHGGSMRVRSRTGVGTIFVVTLPARVDASALGSAEARSASATE